MVKLNGFSKLPQVYRNPEMMAVKGIWGCPEVRMDAAFDPLLPVWNYLET